MGFFGTTLVGGAAVGVVIRTGDRSVVVLRCPPPEDFVNVYKEVQHAVFFSRLRRMFACTMSASESSKGTMVCASVAV